jgi:predicted GIY-YIG superfamily endonuclease
MGGMTDVIEGLPTEAGPVTAKTALYRIWGTAGLLLYIGISKDFGARWKQHAKAQPWWDEMKRLTADEWFDSRELAEAAEIAAIKAERPQYNAVHNRPSPKQDLTARHPVDGWNGGDGFPVPL